MKENRLKSSISFLFLAFFLATKLLGLHALTHNDDKDYQDHCEICHNIAADSHNPAVVLDYQEVIPQEVEFVLQKEIGTDYDFQVSYNSVPSLLFSRPPPSILFLG